MYIEIKTKDYFQNSNFNSIADALIKAGHKYQLTLDGKYSAGNCVTITTDAPEAFMDGVDFTRSAVIVR